MEDHVEIGRQLYGAQEFHEALIEFTRAMHLCPCNKGQKRKRCFCKDFEAVAVRDGSMCEEAMFTCSCGVAKTFPKCSDSLHLTALDYRAATFEALEELDRAEADAKWMIEMAPHLPHGYLRLGKIARLQKNLWFAWKVYSGGVDATKNMAPDSSPKLQQLRQMLRPLQMRFKRKDPISLPLEIIFQIVANFDIVDLTKCSGVSRAWRQTLTSGHSGRLWRQLVFYQPPPLSPSTQAVKALVARSGYTVKRIIIKDSVKFKLNQAKLTALLRKSKLLEHLELCHAYKDNYRFPFEPGSYQNLSYLAMDSFINTWANSPQTVSAPPDTEDGLAPTKFLTCIAASLVHLDLCGVPPSWHRRVDVPDFPRLKTLRLEQKGRPQPRATFPVFHLTNKTPELEQLCLLGLSLECSDGGEWMGVWPKMWEKLKVFVFRLHDMGPPDISHSTIDCITLLNCINWGNGFRHLDLDIQCNSSPDTPDVHEVIFCSADDLINLGLLGPDNKPISPGRQFAKLRSLRLDKMSQNGGIMRRLFEQPAVRGQLQSFDIVFPVEPIDRPVGEVSVAYLEGYAWLRGLESIRCIGLSGFSFAKYPITEREAPLPGFLASLPNLETVSLGSDFISENAFSFLAMRIVRETTVKTLYQTCVRGVEMDLLEASAEEYGVKVIWGERPRQWPVPLDD
ncbi:hypothetical protein XA68_16164 [Ophiocordyceps unilateralis]|uniref:F-box domain-containing protein n=1 Tax=Ophiocordyceps unilateralis TaxID=268505 RepID=A0A2A9PLS1_OPHUN|nr:hypothetical protein XA68_16164 [Ophiocordyceps unilateralis]